jgi:hypothetical protein
MPIADDEGVIATAALTTPLLQPTAVARDPFVEVRLYRRGADPVALFRSRLAGPRRDRLDVRRIQTEHGLRALFAFKPGDSRRGLLIRPDPVAGYSALPFRNGAVIVLDGEPKVCIDRPSRICGLLPAVRGYCGTVSFACRLCVGVLDEAGVGDRRRLAGAGGDGDGRGEWGSEAAAVVEGGQRALPAMDPR